MFKYNLYFIQCFHFFQQAVPISPVKSKQTDRQAQLITLSQDVSKTGKIKSLN